MRPPRRAPPLPFSRVVLLLLVAAAAVVFFRWRGEAGTETGGPPSPTTPSTRPTATASATASEPLPPCAYADEPTARAGYDDWAVTLLDTRFRLPASYAPSDLVPVTDAGFASAEDRVRSFVVPDLAELRAAAADAGVPIDVIVAYRSYEQQEEIFQLRVEEFGYAVALTKAARPGHSEHQLGTTVDLTSRGDADVTAAWGDTATGRWVAENAHRFGFVESYPRGRSDVTCYTYEPWHFRYVGRDLAAHVRASGLTLREYLWSLPSS